MQNHHSIERLKATIQSFVRSNQPGAMLIHGPWGVGKTHGVLEALRAKDESEQKPFSYVSLYGIASLDDIYMRLSLGWVNKISQKAPEWLAETIKTVKESTIGRRTSGALGSIAATFIGKDQLDAISASVAGLLVSKMLIVIDDLERKDPNLSIQAILGVVSYLVESRECRVIFITNDGEIKGDEQLAFDAHKEKVFDYEAPYTPGVEENAEIFSASYKDFLWPTLLALGISNLRVIRRTVRVLEKLDSKIQKNCNLARISVLTSAAKICCLYFGFREKMDLERMKDTSSIEVAMYMESEKGEDHGLTEGDKLIVKAGFSSGPIDDFLIEVIKTGETGWEEFTVKVEEMQEHHEELVTNSTFEKELQDLINNYSNTDPNIANYIKKKCEDNLLLLRHGTIDWAGQILVELGQPDFRDEWFRKWAAANMKKLSNKDIRHVLDGIDSVPNQLKVAYKEEAERRQPELDIEKELLARFTNNIFYPSQIDQIANLPLDRYVSWLRDSKSEQIRGVVRQIFSDFHGRGGSEGAIADKTLAAVDQLAAESPMNALRAKYYKSALPKRPSRGA